MNRPTKGIDRIIVPLVATEAGLSVRQLVNESLHFPAKVFELVGKVQAAFLHNAVKLHESRNLGGVGGVNDFCRYAALNGPCGNILAVVSLYAAILQGKGFMIGHNGFFYAGGETAQNAFLVQDVKIRLRAIFPGNLGNTCPYGAVAVQAAEIRPVKAAATDKCPASGNAGQIIRGKGHGQAVLCRLNTVHTREAAKPANAATR